MHSRGGLSQLMGVAHKRMRARAIDQQEECKLQLIVVYSIQQRNSIKMMQKSLTSKYNKLLSFRCHLEP